MTNLKHECESIGLTNREQEVAIMVAWGESNKAIARKISVTERTVKAHLTAIFTKLHITGRVQLALFFHGIKCDWNEAPERYI